jgi:hypothetical protein
MHTHTHIQRERERERELEHMREGGWASGRVSRVHSTQQSIPSLNGKVEKTTRERVPDRGEQRESPGERTLYVKIREHQSTV